MPPLRPQMKETTEERTKGASRQYLSLCLWFLVFIPMHSYVWNWWETWSCGWSKHRETAGLRSASISLGKLHRTWFLKLGIVNTLQKSPCYPTQMTLNYTCLLHRWPPTFVQNTTPPAELHKVSSAPDTSAQPSVVICQVKALGSKHGTT